MEAGQGSFEGIYVVLSYTEADHEGEGTAALVYRVKKGRLETVYGVLNLPSGTCWNDEFEQYEQVLELLVDQGVTDVYVPFMAITGTKFFGMTLGYFDISEEPNEQDEIECWGEFGNIPFEWDFFDLLTQAGIQVHELDVTTMEVVPEE